MESTSDLSLEQIKEQMALRQRLQERKRRNSPYFTERNRELGRQK